ncbi:NFATC2-interacting protein-like [Pelobates fuscus]|uniref:NFATC2-interacting protein-like n=1 Tax=Pelobates fuscus TaxID=191477 RepID=UPI002FE49F7E
MADDSTESSDSDVELVRPRHAKRRRIVPGTIPAMASVYSTKVINSLKLLPNGTSALAQTDKELQSLRGSEGDVDIEVVAEVQPPVPKSPVFGLSDSEEEEKTEKLHERVRDSSPSPPPTPKTPEHKRGRAYRKIREMDACLKDLGTFMSPKQRSDAEEPDVIMVGSSPAPELAIKVRRRGEIFKINIGMREPLWNVAESVASRLNVEPSQILLLLRDEELDLNQTPQSLNLTVADIIDCMVLSLSNEQNVVGQDDKICLKVQGKEKESHLDVFVGKCEPLQSLMDQYSAAMGLPTKAKVSFIFEGKKLTGKSTVEELGLESDDIIEVWA